MGQSVVFSGLRSPNSQWRNWTGHLALLSLFFNFYYYLSWFEDIGWFKERSWGFSKGKGGQSVSHNDKLKEYRKAKLFRYFGRQGQNIPSSIALGVSGENTWVQYRLHQLANQLRLLRTPGGWGHLALVMLRRLWRRDCCFTNWSSGRKTSSISYR